MKIKYACLRQQISDMLHKNGKVLCGVVFISVLITAACNLILSALGIFSVSDESYLAVTGLLLLFTTLVSAPISMGLNAVMLHGLSGSPVTLGTALSFYVDGRKLAVSIFGMLYYTLITLVWAFAFGIPVSLLIVISPQLYLVGITITVFLVTSIVISRMPGLFILARDPQMPIIQAFRTAKLLMQPYKWHFFCRALLYGIFFVFSNYFSQFLSLASVASYAAQMLIWIANAFLSMLMYLELTAYFLKVEQLSKSNNN